MVKNEMRENASPLVPVNYAQYIKLVQEMVESGSLFTVSETAMRMNIANIALQIANQVPKLEKSEQAKLDQLFRWTPGTKRVTMHYDDENDLSETGKQLRKLRDAIAESLRKSIEVSNVPKEHDEYIRNLLFPISSVNAEIPRGLHYPFHVQQNVTKRRIHAHSHNTRPDGAIPRYRGYELSIEIRNIGKIEEDLINGFCQVLSMNGVELRQIEDVRAALYREKHSPGSDIARIVNLIRKESLAKIKGEACWQFWNKIIESMAQKYEHHTPSSDERAGLSEMQRELRNLKRFRAFLRGPLSDGELQVSYEDEHFNLRTIFARNDSDAYNPLPLFPEIAGTLGETHDSINDRQVFAYAMRWKLNGAVRKIVTLFQYRLLQLSPKSQDHIEALNSQSKRSFVERIMRTAILYYVLFKLDDDDQFEPRLRRFIGYLSASNKQIEKDLERFSTELLHDQDLHNRIRQAKIALEKYFRLGSAASTIDLPPSYLVLQNGMLNLNIHRILFEHKFLRADLFTEEYGREALRYVTVGDAQLEQDAFYVVPLSISFHAVYLSDTKDEYPEASKMNYDIENWFMLPILFVHEFSYELALKNYSMYRRIVIPYKAKCPFDLKDRRAGIYHWAFLLLTYVCLDVLWQRSIPSLSEEQYLFLPLIRIHSKQTEIEQGQNKLPEEEKIIAGIGKTLAHILSSSGYTRTLANTQGFTHEALQVKNKGTNYKMSNGLSSLYNVLPRRITPSQSSSNKLAKLAIITISSCKSDHHTKSPFYRTCSYGEIIECDRLSSGDILVKRGSTFAVNEDSDTMYTTPRTLLDQIRRIVNKGYKHIVYIAKAPYTNYTHMTSKEEDEELYFMSHNIIGGVTQAFPDITLYPVFYDRYYVNKISSDARKESLYVDDTGELRILFSDPNKSIVVFFAVMNGIHVEEQRQYHYGVVIYSTLINMYENPLYDQAIRNNLLDSNQEGSLRKDILDLLGHIHAVRYERRESTGVQLKLDPYEACLGPESVGTRAIIPAMDYRANFNMLSFLALVRGMLSDVPTPKSAKPTEEEQNGQ